MPECGNPECRKEIPEGRAYCNEECLKQYYESKRKLKGDVKDVTTLDTDPTIEVVLKYIGIEKKNFTKDVAYRHWERFIEFARDNSGKSWSNFIKPRLRSYIGIDHRYIEAFLDSCLAWGVIDLKDGNLFFLGVPKEGNGDAK